MRTEDSKGETSDLPIGCQVWPLRTMLEDFPSFAKMLAEIGVMRLELCSPIGFGPEFASLADARSRGMKRARG
jgi:hypothetical protein